ncbi:hypothetical protein QYF61_017870 [Mycteria americana]|uniref:Uncharacterized protein n=1 Tax=Mycteria americana TaxID=33587 RepID=A0AAN7S3T7_MYCAM|nr:hypothetical protein QYF61_017870 [Mycteria americana]
MPRPLVVFISTAEVLVEGEELTHLGSQALQLFGVPSTGKINKLAQVQQRATRMVEGWSACPEGTGLVQPREEMASGAPNSNLPIFLRRLLRGWSFIAVHGGKMRTMVTN